MRDTLTIRDLERQFMNDTRSKQAQSNEKKAFSIDGRDLLELFVLTSFVSAVSFIAYQTIYAF